MIDLSLNRTEAFRKAVADRLGLVFDDRNIPELVGVLRERTASTGSRECEDYLKHLCSTEASEHEWRILAERLTIGETHFFRNPDHFRALTEAVIPELGAPNLPQRAIQVLSAGCSSGEEPYTLAILLSDLREKQALLRFSIRAVDINRRALEKAREGRYTPWALRQTSAEVMQRYFRSDGHFWTITPELRSSISFEELNLVAPESHLGSSGTYDVIFCRNVLMYFSPETARGVVARLADALVPGGFLFLGHAETLRGVSDEFDLVQSHGTFFYQRRDCRSNAPTLVSRRELCHSPRSVNVARPMVASDCWSTAIHEAGLHFDSLAWAARTHGPSRPTHDSNRAPSAAEVVSGRGGLEAVRRAFEEERFQESLDLLADLANDVDADLGAALLRAVVLANRGELEASRSLLESLLGRDQFNPGGHYLMGFCRQQAGEYREAIEHYRNAIYLDPNFAMAYLQMGWMAKRRGDTEAAIREFRQAFELFRGEDPERILLFGGGFHRSALLGLCQAELRSLGGDR